MSCTACSIAMTKPRIDLFTVGCVSCKARALAATGAHEESAEAKKITPAYKAALEAMFGDDWQAGAAQTKEWAGRMKTNGVKP